VNDERGGTGRCPIKKVAKRRTEMGWHERPRAKRKAGRPEPEIMQARRGAQARAERERDSAKHQAKRAASMKGAAINNGGPDAKEVS
jgi:hypothetical protein